jgi:hypothetical protein
MAGKIIVSTLQSDTDNSISFVANTGATIFSANISHGIAGSFIANGSITGAKIALGSITGDDIATGQITGNLIATNAISQNNIVSVNASVATVGTLPFTALPAGSVLQVVQIVKTDVFSTASSSYVDVTGLSQAITPKFSTSKILVLVSSSSSSSSGDLRFQLLRDSTAIGNSTGVTNPAFATKDNTQYQATTEVTSYLDSPATTSSTTYKVQIAIGSGTGYINRRAYAADFGGVSSITLMEIAA